VASRGITVNGRRPGFYRYTDDAGLARRAEAGINEQHPAGLFRHTRDIAETVAFLASEEARYITGQVISVDGGISLGKL